MSGNQTTYAALIATYDDSYVLVYNGNLAWDARAVAGNSHRMFTDPEYVRVGDVAAPLLAGISVG